MARCIDRIAGERQDLLALGGARRADVDTGPPEHTHEEKLMAVGKKPRPGVRHLATRCIECRRLGGLAAGCGDAFEAGACIEHDDAIGTPAPRTANRRACQFLRRAASTSDALDSAWDGESDVLAVGRPERKPGTFSA